MEESGEVTKLGGKILRFGWMSTHPDDPSKTNHDLIMVEIGDFIGAVDFGIERGLWDKPTIENARKAKLKKLNEVAPPPMRAINGSTIAHSKSSGESVYALIVMGIFLAICAFVGYMSFKMGFDSASTIKMATAVKTVEQQQKQIETLETAQDCYQAAISKVPLGKDAKPADVSKCEHLNGK